MKINGKTVAVEGFTDGAFAVTLDGVDVLHVELLGEQYKWPQEEQDLFMFVAAAVKVGIKRLGPDYDQSIDGNAVLITELNARTDEELHADGDCAGYDGCAECMNPGYDGDMRNEP